MEWLDVLDIGPKCHERFVDRTKVPELESLHIKLCGVSKLLGKYCVGRTNPMSNTIFYAVDGTIELYTEAGHETVEKGQLLILPAHHPYLLELKSENFSMAWFDLENCSPWRELCKKLESIEVCNSGRQIYHLLSLLYYERSVVLRKPAIKQLEYYLEYTLRSPLTESIEIQRLDLLIRDVEKKLHFQWTVAEMGKVIKYSAPHLHRLFQKRFSKSPIQYLIYLRMERAKYLLIHTTWSIEQIAEQVGYNDVFNFSKRFKKSVGFPPGGFRKAERL
jgi:AraC-like DNA-binding protein